MNTGKTLLALDTDLMIPKVFEMSTSTPYESPKPGVSTIVIYS